MKYATRPPRPVTRPRARGALPRHAAVFGLAALAGAAFELVRPEQVPPLPSAPSAVVAEQGAAGSAWLDAAASGTTIPSAPSVPLPAEATFARTAAAVDLPAALTVHGPEACLRLVGRALDEADVGTVARVCSPEHDAVQAVADGRCDAAVVASPFERLGARADVREVPLADFVLVLVRHESNPVIDLDRDRLEDVCRGRARGWSDVGGRGTELRVYSVFAGAADEARALGFGHGFARVHERGLSIRQVLDRVARDRAGLGVIVVRDVDPGLPCIAIDGVQPSAAAFTAGSYRFGLRLRIVHRAVPRPPAAALLASLTGGPGRLALAR